MVLHLSSAELWDISILTSFQDEDRLFIPTIFFMSIPAPWQNLGEISH